MCFVYQYGNPLITRHYLTNRTDIYQFAKDEKINACLTKQKGRYIPYNFALFDIKRFGFIEGYVKLAQVKTLANSNLQIINVIRSEDKLRDDDNGVEYEKGGLPEISLFKNGYWNRCSGPSGILYNFENIVKPVAKPGVTRIHSMGGVLTRNKKRILKLGKRSKKQSKVTKKRKTVKNNNRKTRR